MEKQIVQVRLPDKIVEKIDKIVERGEYTSRQDFIKDILRVVLKNEK